MTLKMAPYSVAKKNKLITLQRKATIKALKIYLSVFAK